MTPLRSDWKRTPRARKTIDYQAIAAAAIPHLPALCRRWLPDGRREGSEWSSRNPHRSDRKRGSFKINLHTGRWADFATGDRGGDAISLAAFVHGLSQWEAALELSRMLGLHHEGRE